MTSQMPFWRFFLLTIVVLSFGYAAADQAGAIPSEQRQEQYVAEWNPAKEVVMHTPSDELFYGVIHPAAALFEGAFSQAAASREHQDYMELLEKQGIRVRTVEAMMMTGTLDSDGQIIQGSNFERLREFAAGCIKFDAENLIPEQRRIQAAYKLEVINSLHPRELAKVAKLQPTVILHSTKENTFVSAEYQVHPLSNLYFSRDQFIVTSKGIILSSMNSIQREREVDVLEFALSQCGMKPIYRIQNPGKLEGGDFLPGGEVVYIGHGLRTNDAAIQQLLERDLFGAPTVVVVNDLLKEQAEMHLDTYFNLIAPDLAVLSERRLNAAADSRYRLSCTIYQRAEGRYQLERAEKDFVELLRSMDIQIVGVSAKDQEAYGINFLTLREREIVMLEGASSEYARTLQELGVKVHLVDFENMKRGWGAAHCTTNVIREAS